MNNTNKRNDKGEGSIAMRPNGTYYGRITIPGFPKKTVYGKTEREVKQKLREYKESVIRGEAYINKMRVSEYIEEWLINFKQPMLKPTSYDRLEMTYNHHIKNSYVGKCQLGSIKSSDLQKLISSKTSSLSYSSIKKIYELLKACFTHAVISKDLTHNPMDGVIMPKESVIAIKTKEISILSGDNIEAIHAAAKATYSTGKPKYRYAYAYMLILNTGLRCGEALALTWDCIDFKKGTITVKKSVSTVQNRENKGDTKSIQVVGTVKTKQGNRIIPMNDVAREALLFYKNLREASKLSTDLVIFTQTGKISQHGEFQRMLNKILGESHSEHIGIHALRHTFATNLLNSGADIKVVSKLLGHSSVNITYNTYIHPSIDDSVNAVNLLNSRKIG